ncbi:hypothetical protein C8J55DRAFT_556482 [Lentinula edodes]|uniref:Uncharacterized protein n=1 Tax=Lentinula lateritia TaxID=40482 RepID=A0A9W9AWF6_9AGAR|nr:hypothetical protein C8J55DRAFT_556482 [Lentinula edodes]
MKSANWSFNWSVPGRGTGGGRRRRRRPRQEAAEWAANARKLEEEAAEKRRRMAAAVAALTLIPILHSCHNSRGHQQCVKGVANSFTDVPLPVCTTGQYSVPDLGIIPGHSRARSGLRTSIAIDLSFLSLVAVPVAPFELQLAPSTLQHKPLTPNLP